MKWGDSMNQKVSVTYTNTLGQSVVISNAGPYKLKSHSGFGVAENEIKTQQVYGLDGVQKLYSTIGLRDMEVEFFMLSSSFEENVERWKYVSKVFNPKLPGKLTYKVFDNYYEIDVEVTKGPTEDDGVGALYHKPVVQFSALNPYWRDLSEFSSAVPLNKLKNTFTFPMRITNHFTFSEMIPGEIIEIDNSGDSIVGGVFTLSIRSTVVDPKIYNVITQEFFGWKGTYESGDVITLSTEFKKKQTLYTPNGGTSQNAMGLRMPGSTFLQLDNISPNFIQLQATSGLGGVIGTLDFKPVKVGV